jgi:hypothetical protein
LKKHEEWLLELVRQEPDLTLEEIQRRLLDERQQKAGLGSVWRFFDRHGISFKKAFGRPSRIGLMLPRRERHGRTINLSSIPTDRSSSTNRHLNQNGALARLVLNAALATELFQAV